MTTNDATTVRSGPPVYEVGEFIWHLTASAAYQHIPYNDEDDEARHQAEDDAWDLKLTKRELLQLCAGALEDLGCLECVWCGVDTGEIGEYYMVHDDIWSQYGPRRGCLCIGCLERHMGRQLTPDDFPRDIPTNSDGRYSDRLLNRLGY